MARASHDRTPRELMLLCRCTQRMGAKTRETWHTDNSLFGKAGDDMEKIALFSP